MNAPGTRGPEGDAGSAGSSRTAGASNSVGSVEAVASSRQTTSSGSTPSASSRRAAVRQLSKEETTTSLIPPMLSPRGEVEAPPCSAALRMAGRSEAKTEVLRSGAAHVSRQRAAAREQAALRGSGAAASKASLSMGARDRASTRLRFRLLPEPANTAGGGSGGRSAAIGGGGWRRPAAAGGADSSRRSARYGPGRRQDGGPSFRGHRTRREEPTEWRRAARSDVFRGP